MTGCPAAPSVISRVVRGSALSATLVLLGPGSTVASAAGPGAVRPPITVPSPPGPATILPDAVDTLVVRAMRARRIPGLALAVVEDGRIAYAKGYGTGNLETDSPVTPTSVFEIASITKPFTAAAVMMLVEEGKVHLDDRIGVYLDDLPDAWRGITVRQLLTHTAGLPTDAIVSWEGSALLDISTKAAFDFIARSAPSFAPGERAAYSDAGYLLLGMIIEKSSGGSYRDFMQRRFFDPLGMTRSGIIDRWRILKDRVPVYTLRDGQLANWRRDWQYELPSFFGIYSTVEDLAKFDAALRGGRLLDRASLEAMWAPARLANGQDALVSGQMYGLGWELGNLRGHRTVGHSGASGTNVLRFLDEPVTVIVLTNLDLAAGPNAAVIARRVAELLRPEYRSIASLMPAADPDPATTRGLRDLLGAMAQGQASPLMTAGHTAFYHGLPADRRAQLARQLSTIDSLRYLGSDVVAHPWSSAEPTTRILHYRADTPRGPFDVSFDLTATGQVSTLRLAP